MNENPWLMQGDCLERMKEIPDGSADAVICDLPYGKTACCWDRIIDPVKLWTQYSRICKKDAPIILTAIQPFTSLMVMSNKSGFRYDLVWEKTTASGHLNAKKCPLRAHESILIFCHGKAPYFPQKTTGHTRKTARNVDRGSKMSECYGNQGGITHYDSTERYPRSVFKTTTDKQKSRLSPTQKPVVLMEHLLKMYTLPGWIILDNCFGSGTTGVACANLGRRFIGIEGDEKGFSAGSQRIRSAFLSANNPELQS